MAFLTVEKGNSKDIGKRFSIGERAVIIGRQASGNKPDIVLHDDFVSRHHLEISYQQDSFMIQDLNSTNGTTLDDVRLEPGKHYGLKDNSAIGLGVSTWGPQVVLRFKKSSTVHTARIDESALVGKISTLEWIKVDESKREILVDGRILSLTRKEYDLLLCLYKKAGTVCLKDDLIRMAWPDVIDPVGVSDAAIDQLVHRLRNKIERDPSHPVHLISKKGFGYMLT